MELVLEDNLEDDTAKKHINDLPDEVLEYIFSLVSPYKDLKECMLVCKRWHETVQNVIRLLTLKLTSAINSMDVAWQTITPVEMAPTITKRYSHSACYHENSMYVFGGCTSTSTTFNDLWRLDLNKRQWVRPLTMGTYPSPKACASMVHYKDALIVFGGWTLPASFPLYQVWRLFYELHIYSIVENRWKSIHTAVSPPGMAGHSASVHGDVMVVFGGLKAETPGQFSSSNDIWCFNFKTQEWHKQATSDVKPQARYGQSQIWLSEDHLLIIGGCGGPNMVLSDVWLLSMTGKVWQWREVEVQNREWSASNMWCHRACRIGNQVVIMSKDPRPFKRKPPNGLKSKPRSPNSSVWFPPRYEESNPFIPSRPAPPAKIDRDSNVNGQRGTLARRGALSRGNPNPTFLNGSIKSEHLPNCDSEASTSVKRTKSDQSEEVGRMECEPGPSGISNQERVAHSQPGPSGLNSGGKEDSQDNGTSFSNPNSHNWDRVRPLNRVPANDNHVNQRMLQLAAFRDQDQAGRPVNRARERQLQALQRFEDRMRYSIQARAQEPKEDVACSRIQRTMVICVLDISNVLSEECSVRWLTLSPETCCGGPEETIFYTLVAGRGELIMFGGLHGEAVALMTNVLINTTSNLSNSLHFISAPHGVI